MKSPSNERGKASMKRFRIWPLVALTMALALVATACGGGDEATPTAVPQATAVPQPTTGQATSAPTAAPTATARPTNTAVPVPSGEFTIAMADMGEFDLLLVTGSTRSYLDSMYDSNIGADDNGNLDSKSGWATSWSTNADATQWTVKGRDSIVFHNGDKATAQDVKFGIDRMRVANSRLPFTANVIRDVKSVEAPDNATLNVTINNSNPLWALQYLSKIGNAGGPIHLIPKTYITTAGEIEANKKPVGSGPYKFKSVTPSDRVVMEAVDRHWLQGVPRTKTLTYRLIPEESTRVAMIRNGEADLTIIGRAPVKLLRGIPGVRIFQRNGAGVAAYRFDEQWKTEYPGYGKNPLADVKVRQALDWYAIDRKALVDTFMAGIGAPTMNFPVSLSDPAYELIPVPAFDPNKAKQLLTEAGYPNGFTMDLWIGPRPALPEGPELAEAIAVYWERVGIKVNRRPVAYSAYSAQLPKGFDKPTAYAAWFLAYEARGTLAFVVNHGDKFIYATSRDPKLDELALNWKKALTEQDYIARGKAYMKANYEAANTTTLLTMGEVFAGGSKVPSNWSIGGAKYAFNFDRAAAMR